MNGKMALVVDKTGATLEKGTHDTVVLIHADGRRERVGLRALGSVVIHGDVKLSTGLLQTISAHGVTLTVLPLRCHQGHTPVMGFGQLPVRHATLRHQQHLAYADAYRRINLARRVIWAKLESMAKFARQYAPDHVNGYYQTIHAAASASDVASLMGLEGAATLQHFKVLAAVYENSDTFRFDKRSRQPPKDEVNALMSLAYTLAQSLATQLVLQAGLDVQVGFLHGIHRDRQSLALDLIEPARAELDEWVKKLLIEQQTIKPAMFSHSADGSVWLTKEGRGLFYPDWYREGYRVALHPMRMLLANMLSDLRHYRSSETIVS
ncbi:CRISP-associated protein Cas1 [Nitrosomonas cryotolerans]|uniref:CRISPR-associated endonuclease Cas1 n=1 Tax=Nitrosomonas cryotolerans ATCC 49181 TaxID=1131553 RepID=A0A1N6JYJ2_9PROT|nr:CRISPR-associated endonuclease Cas1 [Nitrosomonas cryotolerans]SFQ11369.1 CRISP-associated protein Cas1 [Nitrosomonas cryotolerans]SIO49116.1 CRISPR-associated protein, Cas1 family [Nitrosomonas cryotolerans ATCC 49181]